MSVPAPTSGILFFVWPKKSIQKKSHPDFALILRFSFFAGVGERGFLPLRQRAASLPLPSGLIPPKTAMLGVEIRDNNPPLGNSFSIRKNQSNPATQKRCSPYAAPSTVAFFENSPKGHRRDAVRRRRGWEAPSADPRKTLRRAGSKRHRGGLSFGDFSLAKQRKVTRLSGRDPTLKPAVAPATHYLESAWHKNRAHPTQLKS